MPRAINTEKSYRTWNKLELAIFARQKRRLSRHGTPRFNPDIYAPLTGSPDLSATLSITGVICPGRNTCFIL